MTARGSTRAARSRCTCRSPTTSQGRAAAGHVRPVPPEPDVRTPSSETNIDTLGLTALAQQLTELGDCLVLVRPQVLGDDQLGAGPVGPGVLAAVSRRHEQRMMRDLDMVLHL